jgi:hypothetical protein
MIELLDSQPAGERDGELVELLAGIATLTRQRASA